VLQCIRNLITSDGNGSEVRLIAGRSHVSADSSYARAYPEHFRAAPGETGRARERTLAMHSGTATIRTPAPPAGLGVEPWRISEQSRSTRLSYGTAPVRVRLSAEARATILQIISQTTERDGLEVGGVLSGPPFVRANGMMELVHGHGPGPNCQRSRSGFTPDIEHDVKLADEIAEGSGGAEIVQAGWHTHPQGNRSASGEGGDLEAWRALRTEVFDCDVYAGLIAVPTSTGGWQFEAFLLGSGHRQDLAQRATFS
jgi:hypothetical protein